MPQKQCHYHLQCGVGGLSGNWERVRGEHGECGPKVGVCVGGGGGFTVTQSLN